MISERVKAIRAATPDILAELFEMQNRICDLCGQPIQALVCAALDHSIPVIAFARGPLPIEDVVLQANAPENLRAAHTNCNSAKHDKTREEWFAFGLDKTIDTQRTYTTEELLELQVRLSTTGRKAGRIGGRATNKTTNGRKSNGGRIGGRASVANGHPGTANGARRNKEKCTGIFTPGMQVRGARAGGLIGGRISGRKQVENGIGMFAPGYDKTKGGRVSGPINGRKVGLAYGLKNNHIRWHVKRGVVSPSCSLCVKSPKP